MYNPFDFDSCIRYIDDNDITFDNARDILEKQDLDFYDECEEVREIALKNARQLINFYHDKYYDGIKDYCRIADTSTLDKILGNYFDYKDMYEQVMFERMVKKHGRN
jgi:hypothetical protein